METSQTIDRAALRTKIKRGLRILLLISTLTYLVIYLLTHTKDTWGYFHSLRPLYLLYVFVLWALYLFFDGLRVRVLASALGGKVDLKTAAEVILTGLFLAAVTPFQIGGFPVQLYILKKRSLSLGKSTLVLLFRGLLTTILLAPIFPFIYAFYREYFDSALIEGLFFYLAIVFPVGLAIFVLFMLFPQQMKNRFSFLRRKRISPFYDRFFQEVHEARSGLARYFLQKKLHLFYAFLATIGSTVCFYLIALAIILGLGINAPKIDVVIRQLILNVILMFIPTPGASGVAEAGFYALFSPVCPKAIIAIYTLLWRFFTFYLGVIIGGVVVLQLLKPPRNS
jgi:uncharacterized protein (TIRG00374 family)